MTDNGGRPSGSLRWPGRTVALGEVLLAALLVAAHGLYFEAHNLGMGIVRYSMEGVYSLGGGEARFLVGTVLLGLPAAMLLADASRRLWPGALRMQWTPSRSRVARVVMAVLAAIIVELLFRYVLRGAPLTDDERTQLFQARSLLAGGFSAPLPAPAEFVRFGFVLPVGADRWASVYTPGQAMLLAVGTALHVPHLTQTIMAAGIVFLTGSLARRLWGEREAVLASLLVATSPLLLFAAATYHNVVPTAFFALLALTAGIAAYRSARSVPAVLAGAAVGMMVLCRPADGLVLGAPILAALVWSGAPRGPPPRAGSARALALTCAGGLPFLAVLLISNHAVTGDILQAAYARYVASEGRPLVIFGFGPAFGGFQHTPSLAVVKSVVVVARLSLWLLGWPVWLLGVAVVVGVWRDRASTLLLGLAGLHFVAYFFYAGISVQDLGSVYQLAELPLLAALASRAVCASSEALATFRPAAATWPGRLVAALVCVALLTFWPPALGWISRTAETVRAPVEVAEREASKGDIIVLWSHMQDPKLPTGSWVFFPPLPGPRADDPVLWLFDAGPGDAALVARFPSRRPFRLGWHEGTPVLEPYRSEYGGSPGPSR